MSDESRGPGDEHAQDDPAARAVFKPSRWPGLIWAVPVAALAIVGWLGISALLNSGPTIKVVFPIVGGLQAGTSKVKYRGFDVGEVSSVTLEKSLNYMIVTLDLSSTMDGHLGSGTQYWISGGSLSLNDLSAIKTLISGPYIGLEPHSGKTVHHATGLGKPPVLKTEPKGETLTLLADKLPHISPGSPIFYKGFKVGEIQGTSMQPDGKNFEIFAFIHADRENLINSNTRFWDAGSVRLSEGGGGPGIELESVPALIMGAIAFETPDIPPGQKVTAGTRFKLYDSEDAARTAPGPGAVPYRIVFNGGPEGLSAGAVVQLEGNPAGEVTNVAMQYDPAQSAMQTVVDLVLEPEHIGLLGKPWDLQNPAPQMNAMLNSLIGQGLRAEIGSAIPVVGGKIVQLELVKGQPGASLQPGNPPQIPPFGGGGGVQQIMAQVNDILAKVNAMPLGQIMANIHDATSSLAQLTKSPKTRRTLARLDRTVAHVDALTRQVNSQLPTILSQLRGTLAQAQDTLRQLKGMTSAAGQVNAGPDTTTLPHAMYELSQAAESLRALTDFLNSHPNALILGRGE